MTSPHLYRTSNQGFTLIEILVSATLGTALILIMLTAMTTGVKGFRHTTQRIDSLVEARAALGIISDDSSTMITTRAGELFLKNEIPHYHELSFFTLKPLDQQNTSKAVGDVCLVHYFTAVTQNPFIQDSPYSRKLYRRFFSSADLVERLNDDLPPSISAQPEKAEAIAFNVTRFTVSRNGPFNDNHFTESLSINIQVIEEELAARFPTLQDWQLTSPLLNESLLEKSSRHFKLRIPLGNSKLSFDSPP